MMKRFLNDILRANGRVPDTDLEEMRKNQKEARHYIKLSGGGDDDMEDLPSDYFEDEEDLETEINAEKARVELEREERKSRRISELCFLSFMLIAATTVIGLFVLIGRIIIYPFVRKAANDLDW